jgi:hypothetical protein
MLSIHIFHLVINMLLKTLEYYMNAKSQKMLIGSWNKVKMNVKINNMIDPLYNKNDDDYDNICWNMYWNIQWWQCK